MRGIQLKQLMQFFAVTLFKLGLFCISISCFGQSAKTFQNLIFEGHLIENLANNELSSTDTNKLNSEAPSLNSETEFINTAEYEQSTAELAVSTNPFNPDLTQPLISLAQLYQNNNDHELAITTFQNALHIIRVNRGLFDSSQIPLIESLIISYQALGEYSEVNNNNEYLHYIYTKNYLPDSSEKIIASVNFADSKVRSYLIEMTQKSASSFSFNDSRTAAMESSMIYPFRLQEAKNLYEEVIEQLELQIDNANNLSQVYTKAEMQKRIASLNYLLKSQTADWNQSSSFQRTQFNTPSQIPLIRPLINRGYLAGKKALEQTIQALQTELSPNNVDIANAQLNLADWLLSYEYYQRAIRLYERAYATLLEEHISEQSNTSDILQTPNLLIPTFTIHPYSRQLQNIENSATINFKGYIDISLTKNKNGTIRKVRHLQSSADTPIRVVTILRSFLKDQRMRPTFENGKPVQVDNLAIRYYYTY